MEVVTEKTTKNTAPEGYKRTEVGVIPEDWGVNKLGDIANCYSGGTPNTSNSSYYGGNINWITSSDLNRLRIRNVTGKITKRGLENSSTKIVNEKTLLIALYGATAGVVAMTELKAAINQAVLAIEPDIDSSEFLLQKLSFLKDWIIKKYTQGGQPNLSGKLVKAIRLDLPSLKEQRAIAEALSDVDALIAELDALIEKKQQIKKGAMQQLLSGKKRLPGFSGEWEERKLGELANVKGGKRLPTGWSLQDSANTYPYIKVADMTQGGVNLQNIQYVPDGAYEKIKNYRIFVDDLFISVAGTLGIVGEIPENIDGANLTENADKLTNIKCEKKYLKYYLMSPEIQDEIETTKTIGAQPKLAISRIKEFTIYLPSKLEEQKAIAGILSDMDAEIQALQEKQSKYEKVKQGMMQQLLTGKTRLV